MVIEIRIARLRSRDRAGARASYMNRVAADGSIARGGEAHRQAGRSRGADIKVRVAEGLVGQGAKRDRLIRLRDVKALRDIGGRVVIRIAGL